MVRTLRVVLGPLALVLLVGAAAAPAQGQGQAVKGWGVVSDPDGDCTLKEANGKLTITVPPTLHDLNPRSGKLNAPRVTREIEGDFVVQVKVSGAFRPGEKSTAPQS